MKNPANNWPPSVSANVRSGITPPVRSGSSSTVEPACSSGPVATSSTKAVIVLTGGDIEAV